MKKSNLILAALLLGGLAPTAPAAFTTGLEAGYLTDNKDAIWSGRVGWEFNNTSTLSHQVEFELAYTKHRETLFGPFYEQTVLIPIMLNYRGETTPANKLGFYYGAGLGWSRVEVDIPGSGVPVVSDGAYAFAFQAFTGVHYQVTRSVKLHAGVKFLRIDDAKLFNSSLKVGNDTAITAGVSVKF